MNPALSQLTSSAPPAGRADKSPPTMENIGERAKHYFGESFKQALVDLGEGELFQNHLTRLWI